MPSTSTHILTCVCLSVFVLVKWVCFAKTAEPIEMLFIRQTRVGLKHHAPNSSIYGAPFGEYYWTILAVRKWCSLFPNYFGQSCLLTFVRYWPFFSRPFGLLGCGPLKARTPNSLHSLNLPRPSHSHATATGKAICRQRSIYMKRRRAASIRTATFNLCMQKKNPGEKCQHR